MARPLRIHIPAGFYHVTLRGNHRQSIFFLAGHHHLLEQIVAESTQQEGARVHAYCWMTNHIHLLVQVADKPLGCLMHKIASRYARTVQSHIKTTGHLFERRYHGALIDIDRYLLTVLRYIHLNPVRAGLAQDPAGYRWSSHRAYLGQTSISWLTTGFVMSMLAPGTSEAITQYRSLMRKDDPNTLDASDIVESRDYSQILGDDGFAARVTGRIAAPRLRMTLAEVMAECVERTGIPPELITSPSKARCLAAARAWLAHRAVYGQIANISAVARFLNRSEGAIRQLMARYPRDSSTHGSESTNLRPGTE